MARIWIVEDDPRIGLLIEMTVKKAGHETLRLNDGAKLERAQQKDAPDLLLLDLILREKNGFTLLAEWKERMRTRAIPALIISARSAERDKVRGLMLGAEDYITKPFGVRELQARVELTSREFDLLCYLVRRGGATVTRGQLLRDVWGYASEEDPSRTVDSHIKTLRTKLGDTAGEPRFIQTVRGTGYRLIAGENA